MSDLLQFAAPPLWTGPCGAHGARVPAAAQGGKAKPGVVQGPTALVRGSFPRASCFVREKFREASPALAPPGSARRCRVQGHVEGEGRWRSGTTDEASGCRRPAPTGRRASAGARAASPAGHRPGGLLRLLPVGAVGQVLRALPDQRERGFRAARAPVSEGPPAGADGPGFAMPFRDGA